MATIDDLPPETLYRIFELARVYTSTHYNASLTCRAFRDPGQRALYGHLRFLAGDEDVPRMRLWLASPARQRYPTLSLCLNPTLQDINLVNPAAIELLLAAAPRALELDGFVTEAFLDVFSRPQLRGLKYLSLGLLGRNEDVDVPRIAPSFSLRNLSIRHVRALEPGSRRGELVRAIAAASSASLTSLELLDFTEVSPVETVSAIYPIFHHAAHMLTSLRLYALHGKTARPDLVAQLRHCTSLQRLTVDLPLYQNCATALELSIPPSETTFAKLPSHLPLPPALTHITFALDVYAPLALLLLVLLLVPKLYSALSHARSLRRTSLALSNGQPVHKPSRSLSLFSPALPPSPSSSSDEADQQFPTFPFVILSRRGRAKQEHDLAQRCETC